jgi:NADPH:quinone reductase-like Zn-dependent oxidoreductase
VPDVGEGEILVRVHAAGVNSFDLFVISGMAKEMMEMTNVNAGMMSTLQDLEALAEMVTKRELTVPIAHVFSLEETPQALERLQSGQVQGKVVLDCRSS